MRSPNHQIKITVNISAYTVYLDVAYIISSNGNAFFAYL